MGKMTYEELEALCERMSKRIKKLEGDKMDKALDCYSLQEVARLNARIRVVEKLLSDERDAAAQVMRNEESAIAERDELRSRLKAAEEVVEAYHHYLSSIATYPKPASEECSCSGCTLLAALAKYEQGRK